MNPFARTLILSRPAVIATLLVAFALVLTSISMSVISTHEISSADRRAAHAQQTLVIVNQLLATINEAETAQRGYILTHDDKYLAPYETARGRYRGELAALHSELKTDPGQAPIVTELTSLCVARFAEIERTIQLRRENGIAPALNVLQSGEGWQLMNEIRQQIQTIQKQELGEVAEHTASAVAQARAYQRFDGVLLLLALALGGTVAWLLMRRLHDLEGLIKVCAWTQRVQWKGQWIPFEEYLAKRFNLHCTHGISDEAAQQLSRQIANTPVPPEVGG
ncbi:MAG TPA: CHASE3 domain-containing protein [Opitutaceae bacterium]|nr:CHASE3 domain-containing protein [Opitutaceae bacterium]